MRDLYKFIIVGIIFLFAPFASAKDYKVLVIPDNIVTENNVLDSYIYNDSSEFFADDIVTLLNRTDYIGAPTVSEIRAQYKQDPSALITAKNVAAKFQRSYNLDYIALKKLADKSNARYVLLLTSYVDAENYILRRTLWDFLNIPGATVIDPAYKLSTYAVLIDTEKNLKLWSDTYYKTISVCENRIITRGPSPQTEQLQKIKDYSRYLSPQIAQNIQQQVLPPSVLAKETNRIDFDMGNIDNVFTKKYRHLGKEYSKVYAQKKDSYNDFVSDTKTKIQQYNEKKNARKFEKQEQKMQSKLEVKAKPMYETELPLNDISNTVKSKTYSLKNAVFKKNQTQDAEYSDYFDIDIKKKKKNNLYGEYSSDKPQLRDYD